jgi:RNA polymerase sigma factor (sigma-70 family)
MANTWIGKDGKERTNSDEVRDMNKYISAAVDKFLETHKPIKSQPMLHLITQKSVESGYGYYRNDYREELINICWMRVLHAQKVNPDAKKAKYIRVVLQNCLRNWLDSQNSFDGKSKRAEVSLTEYSDEENKDLVDNKSLFVLEQTDRKLEIYSYMLVLTPAEKVVIDLIYGTGGMQHSRCIRDVSRILKKSRTWVESRHNKALQKMRERAKVIK